MNHVRKVVNADKLLSYTYTHSPITFRFLSFTTTHSSPSCCPIHSCCCCFSSRLSHHYDLQNKVCRGSQGDSVKLVSTSSPPPLLCLVLHPPRVRAAILAETRETLTDKRC